MDIYVGCGREVGNNRCGDRQQLSGGSPYSGVVAVRLLGRLGVGKFCGIVSDGESGPVISGRGRGGGMVEYIGKGRGGLARCGGCWQVSGWEILSSVMRVLGLSGKWENIRGEAH